MEPVFEVTFGCSNCGASWSDEYEPEVVVTDKSSRVGVNGCDRLGCRDRDCCYVVSCPNCNRIADVTIEDRQPVSEEYQ